MSYIDELRELAKLKEDGIITEEEFLRKKEAILNKSDIQLQENDSLEDNQSDDSEENCPNCGGIITSEDLKNKLCPHCSLKGIDEKHHNT